MAAVEWLTECQDLQIRVVISPFRSLPHTVTVPYRRRLPPALLLSRVLAPDSSPQHDGRIHQIRRFDPPQHSESRSLAMPGQALRRHWRSC